MGHGADRASPREARLVSAHHRAVATIAAKRAAQQPQIEAQRRIAQRAAWIGADQHAPATEIAREACDALGPPADLDVRPVRDAERIELRAERCHPLPAEVVQHLVQVDGTQVRAGIAGWRALHGRHVDAQRFARVHRGNEPRGGVSILGRARDHQHAAGLRGEMGSVPGDRVHGSAMVAVLRLDKCSINLPAKITRNVQKMGDARCRAGALASIQSLSAGSEMIISPATQPMSPAPIVTKTGKRLISFMSIALPKRITGTVTTSPAISIHICPFAAPAIASTLSRLMMMSATMMLPIAAPSVDFCCTTPSSASSSATSSLMPIHSSRRLPTTSRYGRLRTNNTPAVSPPPNTTTPTLPHTKACFWCAGESLRHPSAITPPLLPLSTTLINMICISATAASVIRKPPFLAAC